MSKTLGIQDSSTMRVTTNQIKRTYTIRTESAKYRTCKLTKEEFEELECNTEGDWKEFTKKCSVCNGEIPISLPMSNVCLKCLLKQNKNE